MPMHLELLVNNDERVLSTVQAFTGEALRQTSLGSPEIDKLVELVGRSARAAIDHAYPVGEDGSVKVGITESRGKLVVTVRDYGMPQDIKTLERQLHEPNHRNQRLFGTACADVADEIHWVAYGPQGKALQIVKWLHNTHITAQAGHGTLETFQDGAPLAPHQQYVIRPMAAEEAVQVSQLIYRAYGGTYFNRDVYYPERIAAHNERGTVLSFVAQGEDGRLVGHYALERNQEGPVAEGGQAVVDPAHRGRGLLTQLKGAAVEAARHLGLVGLYSDAVTVHTLTQKSDLDYGAHLTCVDLGIAPRSEHFRGISERQPQRVTCMLYFLWFESPQPRTVHVPSEHRDVVEAIYGNLQCPVTFDEGAAPQGHGTLKVSIDAGARKAFIRADRLGADTVTNVRHAKRELIEHSHAEAVFVELPLQDPGTPHVALDLEQRGFSFAGIAPHFSAHGDLLRLVYLTEPLTRAPIKTYEEFATSLVDYALSQQARARQSLG
ncbi:MAG: GNAT family N-acetyltransferase [Pirellulaceae bacterium]